MSPRMRFENQAYLLKQMEEKDSRKNEAPAAHLFTLTRLTSFAGIEQHGSLGGHSPPKPMAFSTREPAHLWVGKDIYPLGN